MRISSYKWLLSSSSVVSLFMYAYLCMCLHLWIVDFEFVYIEWVIVEQLIRWALHFFRVLFSFYFCIIFFFFCFSAEFIGAIEAISSNNYACNIESNCIRATLISWILNFVLKFLFSSNCFFLGLFLLTDWNSPLKFAHFLVHSSQSFWCLCICVAAASAFNHDYPQAIDALPSSSNWKHSTENEIPFLRNVYVLLPAFKSSTILLTRDHPSLFRLIFDTCSALIRSAVGSYSFSLSLSLYVYMHIDID